MTAKKRWLNKIYHDSQDFPKSTQSDISWSSSESDEETRMKKCKVESAKDRWITSDLKHDKKTFPVKMRNDMCQSSNSYQSDAINVWDLNNSAPKVIHTPNATCSKISKIDTSLRQYCESPIITNMKVEELSPVIVQTRYDFNLTKQASPILGNKMHVLKKICSNYKTRRIVKQLDESSPDLFEMPSTQIIESDSPELKNDLSLFEPDTILPTERIDPFPSQHSSQIINSNTESSPGKDISLYHQPAPKRKRYKKGGFASLLQKTLHLQRTRISIWHHEMYTKKIDNIISFEQGKVIDFVVKNKWKEYGNTLLDCHSSDLLPMEDSLELPTKNNFIVIVGFSANLNFTLNTNSQYKLFPPYSIKTVNYKSQEVSCYFNVTKLVPLKDL